ncbi:MAG: MFS transporter [Candidatus Margulisiibacteriota bacterium]|nr:MFS transporter [Candidatus Margulisiibacteriota bacterium]
MSKIKKNIVALGFVSFLTDVSSEMILAILPLFLTALGAGKAAIGLIEGVAGFTASIVKTFSGWISDKIRKRKLLVIAGYSISTITKPFIAAAGNWFQVLGVRFLDRVGKGIRTSPRDAIIAESAGPHERGRAFGFHRMMDTSGAVAGTLLASAFLFVFTKFFHMETLLQYRTIFWIAVIPGILSVLTLIFYVKEPKFAEQRNKLFSLKAALPKRFIRFLIVVGIFELAHFSYALFILRASDLGVVVPLIPIIYLVYNLVYAAFAMPAGQLADRFGKKNLLSIGYLLFGVMLFGFAFASKIPHAWILFIIFGLAIAIVDTIPRAMVPEMVSSEVKGTAYGFYYMLIGIMDLPASLVAGILWDVFGKVNGPMIAFSYGAVLAIIAAGLLFVLVPNMPE